MAYSIQEAKEVFARAKHEKWAREFDTLVKLAIAEDKMQKVLNENMRRLNEMYPQPPAQQKHISLLDMMSS